MSRVKVIDPAFLGPMAVVILPNVELTISQRMARFVLAWAGYDPPAAAVYDVSGLEFDPIKIAQEVNTLFEVDAYSRVNAAAKAVTLAFARGSDLDAIASRYPGGVPRQPEESYDAEASVAEQLLRDDRYRRRIWLAPNTLTPHGVGQSYEFYALTGMPSARDVSVRAVEGTPNVNITVMKEGPDPIPTKPELLALRAYMLAENRKGTTDIVNLFPVAVRETAYRVNYTLYPGPDGAVVEQAIRVKLAELAERLRWLGADHTTAHIEAAVISAGGVHNAVAVIPGADLTVTPQETVAVTGIELVYQGRFV